MWKKYYILLASTGFSIYICNPIVIWAKVLGEKIMEKRLYTLIVHSENIAGLLNQITAVFTRRQLNIESLNVSASSINGIHRYTITAWSDEDTITKVTKQIEKKIDVLHAHYYVDNEIFMQEVALFKVSTPILLENPLISKTIRRYGARIMEANAVYAVVEKSGVTDEIIALRTELDTFNCVLQYVSSGRIAVTRDTAEHVNEYLEKINHQ